MYYHSKCGSEVIVRRKIYEYAVLDYVGKDHFESGDIFEENTSVEDQELFCDGWCTPLGIEDVTFVEEQDE